MARVRVRGKDRVRVSDCTASVRSLSCEYVSVTHPNTSIDTVRSKRVSVDCSRISARATVRACSDWGWLGPFSSTNAECLNSFTVVSRTYH